MAKKEIHLIKIEKDGYGLACTPHWFGKRMTPDVEQVTCESCRGTDFYKKEKGKANG
jgi:hypothetical protein